MHNDLKHESVVAWPLQYLNLNGQVMVQKLQPNTSTCLKFVKRHFKKGVQAIMQHYRRGIQMINWVKEVAVDLGVAMGVE